MSENEAAICLVNLYADYERYCSKLGYSVSPNYSKAIVRAIMALEKIKED